MGLSLLSSFFLGSALGKAISTLLVYRLGINLYRASNVPGLSAELALNKTFDLIDFVLAILFTFGFFLVLRYLIKTKNKLISLAALGFNIILFLQINFAAYNLTYTLFFLTAFYLLLIILARSRIKIPDSFELNSKNLLLVANGLLTGFFAMLLVNTVTTTILPLVFLLVTPVFYLLFSQFSRCLKSYGHLIFAFSILMPTNVLFLLIAGAVALVFILKTQDKLGFKLVETILYPACFIILFAYNPLYYLGHLDSVEEGFWLGWLSGLREGKFLYRDIASYHPPLIVWVLDLFQKIVGYSIEHTRLMLHLLQIAGLMMYYFLAKSLLKRKLSIFVVTLMAFSLTTIMVRNNVEIRLGVGLLSLVFLANPLVSGIIAAVAFFTSVEVGIAVIVASSLTILIFKPNKLKNIENYVKGLFLGALPVLVILIITGGLGNALSQISFYANAFSQGYFNLPVERSVTSAFIHWHIINQYVSGYPFLWEIARGGIVAGLIMAYYTLKKKLLNEQDLLAVTLSIFGIVIFRSALGRSDIYHLLFPLLVAIPLIFYILEKIGHKLILPVFSLLLVFVFMRNIVNASFIETKLYGLQTYGKAVGEQEILLTESQKEVVSYIKQNTSLNQSIFVYPWNPEIYFLTQRPNATKHYTPYAFFSDQYQNEMILELKNSDAIIIYNPEMIFANLAPDTLPLLNNYILENYSEVESIGSFKVLK